MVYAIRGHNEIAPPPGFRKMTMTKFGYALVTLCLAVFATNTACNLTAGPSYSPAAQNWEYSYRNVNHRTGEESPGVSIREFLQSKGAEGWELVAVGNKGTNGTDLEDYSALIFKRPK